MYFHELSHLLKIYTTDDTTAEADSVISRFEKLSTISALELALNRPISFGSKR